MPRNPTMNESAQFENIDPWICFLGNCETFGRVVERVCCIATAVKLALLIE